MIKDLESLDLHDTPLKSIRLIFEERKLELIIYHHDDLINEYFDVNINFSDVQDFHIDDLEDTHIDEITTFILSKRDDKYHIDFIMLIGHPCLEVNMSFAFSEVEVLHSPFHQPHRV